MFDAYNEWDLENSNQQIINMEDKEKAMIDIADVEAKVADVCDTAKHLYEKPRTVEYDPFNGNVLLHDMASTFEACMNTAISKNHDYGGSNKDPFANFRNSTIAGVPVERGILVRLMDKMSRISTLLDKEAQVKDEAVDDTIDDAINYLAILKSYRKNNK